MLTAGTRLGPYEIVGALGAGGMGEVYKATDMRLDRIVAVKVLPAHIAADPLARERFEREAKVVSSLDHPHICPLFDVGESDGVSYLVMPCLEGETLADRLGRGPLPLADTLRIAAQICDALDKAHRQGVVHRDLKPANVFVVRRSGPPEIKLLDFGLAKTGAGGVGGPTGAGGAGREVALTAMPTMAPSLTTPGTILGTFQYMAPEQIEGMDADARTDIFAFGAVVYEMATGKKAFEGRSQASVMASILDRDPAPMSSLVPLLPAAFERVVRKCLAKDPDARWQTARDLLDELKWIESAPDEAAVAGTIASAATATRGRGRAALVAAGLVIAAAIGAGVAWVGRPMPVPEPVALTVETPGAIRGDGFALSPDGRQLAFIAVDDKGSQALWLRPLASTTPRMIPGTEQASFAFWSPDSRAVGFFTESQLRRVEVASGALQTIARTTGTGLNGASWNSSDTILFTRVASGVWRVQASGGEPVAVTKLGADETAHLGAEFLPDGRRFLYLRVRTATELSELVWRDLESSEEHVVRRMNSRARYLTNGHLLFREGGALVVQAFDPSSGTVSGDPVQLAPDVWADRSAAAIASAGGMLAYRGGSFGVVSQLTWFDRQGKPVGTVGPEGDYRNPSADWQGERVAVNSGAPSDVTLLDGKRGTSSRLTFGATTESDAIFSPDGQYVAFFSNREPPGIYRKPSNGSRAEEIVGATGLQTWPRDWSSDGRFILYDKGGSQSDTWVLPLEGTDRKPTPYLATTFSESHGHFSPSVKWVAYTSDESGRPDIFVQDFPATGAKFQISTGGGSEPRWRRDGRELFYLAGDGRMMSVDVESASGFRFGAAKPLFQTKLPGLQPPSRRFSVSSDGQRFLMNDPGAGARLEPITVILNWTGLLKK